MSQEEANGTTEALLSTALVTVFGSSNMDLITYTDRSPKAGETIRGRDFKLGFGGKGANQCVACSRLCEAGGRVQARMVSRVGEDLFGENTLQNYRAQGVDTAYVLRTPGAPTGVAQITVERGGSNSIVIVPGANDMLTPSDVAALGDAAIAGSKLLVCQLEVPLETTVAALEYAHARGIYTITNPAPAPSDWAQHSLDTLAKFYECTDLFVPNESELEAIAGMPVLSPEDAEAAARRVLAGNALGAFGKAPRAVVVTLGAKGCLLVRKDEPALAVPVPPRAAQGGEAVDTTGAGDCFIGTLAYFLAAGDSLPAALSKAVEVATVSVHGLGTQTSYPTRAMLPQDLFESNASN